MGILIMLQTSCTKELPLDQDDIDRKLVMSGFLKNGSWLQVRMSGNFGLIEDTSGHNISDAVIVVYRDGLLVDDLDPVGNGVYELKEPVVGGGKYILRASHSSFAKVTGSTTIPLDIDVTFPDSLKPENGYPTLPVTLNDGDEENYYLIRIRGMNQKIVRDSFTQLPIDSVDQLVTLDLISVEKIFDSDQEVSTSRIGFESFSDRFFNGEELKFQIRLSPDQLIATSVQTRTDKVILEVRSVSEEYYRFVRSYELAKPIYGGPFGSFQSIYSNIENGYGILAGYSGITDTLSIAR